MPPRGFAYICYPVLHQLWTSRAATTPGSSDSPRTSSSTSSSDNAFSFEDVLIMATSYMYGESVMKEMLALQGMHGSSGQRPAQFCGPCKAACGLVCKPVPPSSPRFEFGRGKMNEN